MKRSTFKKLFTISAAISLLLSGCSNSDKKENLGEDIDNEMVEVMDSHGSVMVPKNPKRVVALDNRTFETLSDWDIALVAAPKGVMSTDSPYVSDASVQDIGNHSDPNLEVIAAVDPDLVIIGQRFAKYYEDIKELVPNAAVIDLNFDVSEKSGTPGDNLVTGLKNSTTILGEIFDKKNEANALITKFDQLIADGGNVYHTEDTIVSVVVSGGDIGYSAPRYGRVWGPMYDIFGWKSALEVSGSTSDHMGDDISVEAIAQSNPDWIFVLDRDAAVSSSSDAIPAQDVINNSLALKNTTAITNNQIIYAPKDTYTNESIQTYMELFENIANTLQR